MRALAQRSAEAAREIKTLIDTSAHQVEASVKLVSATQRALGAIVDGAAQMDGLVAGIVTSTEAQSAAIVSVNGAVGELRQVVTQNANMVGASDQACRRLGRDAATLAELVSRFDLGEQAPLAA